MLDRSTITGSILTSIRYRSLSVRSTDLVVRQTTSREAIASSSCRHGSGRGYLINLVHHKTGS